MAQNGCKKKCLNKVYPQAGIEYIERLRNLFYSFKASLKYCVCVCTQKNNDSSIIIIEKC